MDRDGTTAKRDELVPVCCKCCKAIYGYTDGLHLYRDETKKFMNRRPVTYECTDCKRQWLWTPRLKTKAELLNRLQSA